MDPVGLEVTGGGSSCYHLHFTRNRQFDFLLTSRKSVRLNLMCIHFVHRFEMTISYKSLVNLVAPIKFDVF